VLLTSEAMRQRLLAEPEIHVPDKAVLALRVSGASAPQLSFHQPTGATEVPPAIDGLKPRERRADGVYTAETTLTRPALVRLTDEGRELGRWQIELIPDAPPAILIVEEPLGDAAGTLTVKWKTGDDYGVTAIASDLYLADQQDDGEGFAGTGIFEFEPPRLPVALRRAPAREEAGTTKANLAEHPWAGFMVELTLTAKDAAGNATDSLKKVFRLPERLFVKPLARALIEQRKQLILEPESSGHVTQMLEALLTYPKGLIDGSGTHIAIAAVVSRLNAAEGQDDIDTGIRMLWQIAVGIEEGRMADARAELEALRQELERALRDGAPPERIAELMEKLREAMNRYMQSLMEETQRQMQQGTLEPSQQQGQPIRPEDLSRMLDMIEKLAQSGANEAARELLSQLEDILRNLRPGMSAQRQGAPGENALGEMLDDLSEMMRQQRQLMDDTQRRQGQGESEGEPGFEGQFGMGDLGDRQEGLGEALRRFMERLGQNGITAPPSLGDAGENMDDAQGALRQGEGERALSDQGQAMSKLREGAQDMIRQMMQQSQGQQGNQGRHGEARGDDRDPLGRPMPNRGEDYGPRDDMLPSELAIQRAREILEMLRTRAGDAGLPRLERDYIERLLRGLY
jgi:uncharacterized protein (TIGR02302 family)